MKVIRPGDVEFGRLACGSIFTHETCVYLKCDAKIEGAAANVANGAITYFEYEEHVYPHPDAYLTLEEE